MAVDQEQGLDGLPLLKATFDDNVQSLHEKFQEGGFYAQFIVPVLTIFSSTCRDRSLADQTPCATIVRHSQT
jgi:hypothetical protein